MKSTSKAFTLFSTGSLFFVTEAEDFSLAVNDYTFPDDPVDNYFSN